MTEWRRRNPKRSTTEMGQENQRSCSRALQRQASFIANRGWKSSNSSPLSVGGELFPLTSPFIELAMSEIRIFQQLSPSLIGVQSAGTFRVARWFLATDGRRVLAGKTLEKGTPLVSFPTTGAIRER